MVDEQLGAAVEELGQRLLPVVRLEDVLLLDRDPGQLSPLPRELVTAAGELLLALEELAAGGNSIPVRSISMVVGSGLLAAG